MDRLQNVLILLSGLPKLNEEAGLNSMFLQQARCFINLFNSSSLVHRIKNLLRSTLRTHPGSITSGPCQIPDIIFLQKKIGSHLDLKPELKIFFIYKISELFHPPRFQSKDVVTEPYVIIIEFFFHQLQFS